MSELPKIYANCKAGCLWETVHKSEFEKSASLARQYAENGRYKIEVGKEYKAVCEQTGLSTFTAYLPFVFAYNETGLEFTEDILSNPANPDTYSNSFTLKILDWRDIDDTDQSEVIYEYCGVRYSHTMTNNSSVIKWFPDAIYLTFDGELFIYNADATITAKDGKSAYDIAVEKGFEGTEEEWLESLKSYAFANSIEECTDTSRFYVLPDGYIYAYMTSTVEQEVTKYDEIIGTADEPYSENSRLGSDGSVSTLAGYTVTPYIDLTKAEYQGKTVEIHLDGNKYASETRENYIQCGAYDSNKSAIHIRPFTTLDRTDSNCVLNVFDNAGMTLSIKDTTSAIMTVPVPLEDDSGNTVSYMRFCGLGTETNTVAIYYKTMETVTETQWTNTGFLFINNGVDEETAEKIATLNNEGADPTTVSLLPSVVKDFYNSAAYSSEDYSTSHLERITYPCRADIPIPYTVKWSHNENAMRTTVAVDTKAIGTSNAHTLLTYDATGVDNYPLYNLIPNKTYYYKVTHLLSDGSLVEAKSGSFKTSSEAWRLIYIDGTQNVRDLGGWTGLDGKKVRYGKIFRGAAFSDSSYPELMLTGKGKRSLGELKIQAELNLGAIDTETSIAANCSYKKVGYTSYATAITSETHKAMFKELLEYIISCLDGTLTETGLYTVERNIYMHCQGGCDRTGTLSFLLLGLLGVSESDLAKEYELSSFSNIGIGRLRTTTAAVNVYDYVGMVEAIKTYTGDTITDKFVAFATACGVSSETITSFRNLMLE